jgi:hypothetical protein
MGKDQVISPKVVKYQFNKKEIKSGMKKKNEI